MDEVKESTKGKYYQGKTDPASDLAMVNGLQTAQFLLKFGGYEDKLNLDHVKDKNGHLPEGLQNESLVEFKLSINCLAFLMSVTTTMFLETIQMVNYMMFNTQGMRVETMIQMENLLTKNSPAKVNTSNKSNSAELHTWRT